MKCLTRMYHDQGRDVVFYENAAAPHRRMHAAMQAVPLPYSLVSEYLLVCDTKVAPQGPPTRSWNLGADGNMLST